MKEILRKLMEHQSLSREEARGILLSVGRGEVNPVQITAFLTVFMMRMIRVEELNGFRDALLELSLQTDLGDYKCIDLCGTGGDGKNTFNISTLASFIVAGSGEKVAKHGNYGVSSVSGSSNVLEYFGYRFSNDRGRLLSELDKAGICFLHAPLFHPAMRFVGPVRKDLGLKTFFNILGPLVNPSFPEYQVSGVFNLETARLYHYVFQENQKKYRVIYSLDGYDEVSLTGNAKVISQHGENLYEPKDFGFPGLNESDLRGGRDIKESAEIFLKILKGEGSREQNAVVAVNAGFALNCLDDSTELKDCISRAMDTLKAGKALQAFDKLLEVNSKH